MSDSGLAVAWKRGGFCINGDCVEVRLSDGAVQVRDSKNPEGPTLEFTVTEWQVFTSAVKDGEFDPAPLPG